MIMYGTAFRKNIYIRLYIITSYNITTNLIFKIYDCETFFTLLLLLLL